MQKWGKKPYKTASLEKSGRYENSPIHLEHQKNTLQMSLQRF